VAKHSGKMFSAATCEPGEAALIGFESPVTVAIASFGNYFMRRPGIGIFADQKKKIPLASLMHVEREGRVGSTNAPYRFHAVVKGAQIFIQTESGEELFSVHPVWKGSEMRGGIWSNIKSLTPMDDISKTYALLLAMRKGCINRTGS
jgi:hypothetical protein